MPRYVVLYHEVPRQHERLQHDPLRHQRLQHQRRSHWDFMLEDGDHLLAWALAESPVDEVETRALELPDHRLEYLTHEGPISGDRGTVKRIDAGQFDWRLQEMDAIDIELHGEVLNGAVRISRHAQQHWRWAIQRLDAPRSTTDKENA